jgi:hypothetical protein
MTPYGHQALQQQIAQPHGVGNRRILTVPLHEADRLDGIVRGVLLETLRVPATRVGPFRWRAEVGSFRPVVVDVAAWPTDGQRMSLEVRIDHQVGAVFWLVLAVSVLTVVGWVFVLLALVQTGTQDRVQRTATLLAVTSRLAQALPEPPPGGYRGY